MPSMRKKLKTRLSFSKKRSKSTNDLNAELNTSTQNDISKSPELGKEEKDPDSVSQASEMSERTDISEITAGSELGLSASSLSETTDSDEKKAKKRRKFRLSFGRKSRKNKDDVKGENLSNSVADQSGQLEVLVESNLDCTEADSGLERTIDNTTDGSSPLNVDEQKPSPRPKSTGDLIDSIGISDITIDSGSNPDVDQWRMSGLLETVDRSPRNSDVPDNLVISFEKRREQQKSIEDPPTSTSTPKDDGKLQNNHNDKKDSESSSRFSDEVGKSEDITSGIEQETKINITSHPTTRITVKVGKASSDETFVETEGLDYEYASDVHKQNGDDSHRPNGDLIRKKVSEEAITEIRSSDANKIPDLSDEPIYLNDKSVICDIGKGKTVIIRHLEEVLDRGNIDVPNTITADDWLVLNLAKDDWVVVDYRKENGDIVEVLDKSVDAV